MEMRLKKVVPIIIQIIRRKISKINSLSAVLLEIPTL